MYNWEWFHGKKVTVMGLGSHGGGLGVAKWLMRHGARVTVTDLKGRSELKRPIEALMGEAGRAGKRGSGARSFQPRFVLGRHDEKDFRGADMVIRNPAVRKDNKYLKIAERKGIPVETDISLFIALCPFSVTAVTGTKGKSTATALIGEIAKRHDPRAVVGGNIRISPFGFLDRLFTLAEKGKKGLPRTGAKRLVQGPPVILEVSSWQLEALEHHRVSPHIGVVTNVMEDHLNSYSGMAEYARAKSLVLAYQTADDFAVVNVDDPMVMRMGEGRVPSGASFGGRRFPFSRRVLRGDGCFVRGGKIVIRDEGRERVLLPLSALKLPGEHNVSNVLAACAAAYLMGIPVRMIAAAVRGFRGVPGRMEEVAVVRGVKYVNDTTATMADASMAAMRAYGESGRSERSERRGTPRRSSGQGRGKSTPSLSPSPARRRGRDGGGGKSGRSGKRIVLLAGGADKGLRYEEWGGAAKKYCKAIVLFNGTATPKLDRALKAVGYRGSTPHVDSMREAMREARNLAKRGDVVLLSPACASFGIFENEFDRGDQFVGAVKRVKAQSTKRKV